jgi:two-component system sensor histidine kinase QseC
MSSIRGFLITLLFSTIILTIFSSILQGYQASNKEIQQQMDMRLIDMAKLLTNLHNYTSDIDSPINSGSSFAFQIFNPQKELLYHSNTANTQPIAPLKPQFEDVNFNGYRWRSYAFFNAKHQLWILVAERLDIRFNLAEKIVLKSLLPIVLEIPLAALLIWFVVGHALKPLTILSNALKNKRDNDLSPLQIEQPYREVEHVIQSSNKLLKRLALSFEREKHFASNVAHELRTPLSILKIDLFNLKQKLGGQNTDIQVLQRSVDRMEHLVQQILTLYRTTPDQFMATFAWLDLNTLAQSIIAEHYDIFDKKSQSIELIGQACYLNGDQSALSILLLNLIENANKYTPQGGIIRVTLEEQTEHIMLQVEDSGVGIDPLQYKRVFERFYRIDGDCHASNEVGCGIGLSIVKHIVDLHNANIRLQASHFSTGLIVQIILPKGEQHD